MVALQHPLQVKTLMVDVMADTAAADYLRILTLIKYSCYSF